MTAQHPTLSKFNSNPLHTSKRLQARQFGLSLIAWLTVLTSFEPARAEPSYRAVTPATSKSGDLFFKGSQGQQRALHLSSSVEISINGMIAKVTLEQSFKNGSAHWQEGVYVFPLHENTAVNALRIKIGDRVIVGSVTERIEAKKQYEAAKREGKVAALTEQERPNLFTQSIANIPPGESITVEITYLQDVDYRNGAFELAFPMTLTPRYNPGIQRLSLLEEMITSNSIGSGWGTATHIVPDASRITPPQTETPISDDEITNPITINVLLNAGLPLASIDSLYHPVRVLRDDNRYTIRPDDGPVSMDRDFRLRWATTPSNRPQAALFTEDTGAEKYALAMILPPEIEACGHILARNLIFVIDTSGSMQGTSIEQAKSSLSLALDRLNARDTFNIIEFDSTYSMLNPVPMHATARNIDLAKDFVAKLQADGGTEMAPALAEALRQPNPQNLLPQVVFITDGAVGNEAYLFELIEKRLSKSRLFTVGIGSAPNRYFMRKAAHFGRGTYTHIGQLSEVHQQMQALFQKLESAVMQDLTIDWSGAHDIWPQRIPDLYAGEPLVLAAKVTDKEHALAISGVGNGQQWRHDVSANLDSPGGGIATVWARKKIDALMDEKIRGRDEAELKREITALGIQHQLVTPYTSLVAIEQKPLRPSHAHLQSENVPNTTPLGQRQVSYPQGSTAAPLMRILGGVCLLGWLLAGWRDRVVRAKV
ncbi:MAG: marine proteobacterial sortase target protein [Pseudomonadota bacterium]